MLARLACCMLLSLLATPLGAQKFPLPYRSRSAHVQPVTFNNQIVRIMQENCQGCHHPGEVAPFSLMSYEDAASRAALNDVLAMEPEVAAGMREAWRDAPDRQRLVALDNVVTQAIAEAQRYYYTGDDAVRRNLEMSAADLRGAAPGLAEALSAVVLRLDRHIQELLRARPAEQAHISQVRFHDAGPRATTLMREVRREAEEHAANRARYRVYLATYAVALLVLLAYIAARLIWRELTMRGRSAAGPAAAPGVLMPTEPIPPSSADTAPPA